MMRRSVFVFLLAFAGMWRRYVNGDIKGLRYHPMLAYSTSRNIDSRKNPQLFEWVQGLLKWPPGEKEKAILDYLGIITTLCLYSRRGGNRDVSK